MPQRIEECLREIFIMNITVKARKENKMDKVVKKLIVVLLAVAMTFSVVTTDRVYAAENTTEAADLGTVTFTIERMTIGQGFYIEPVQVEIKPGYSAKEIFKKALKAAGGTYTASTKGGFYVKSLGNADTGVINIPQEISTMPEYSYTYIGEDGLEHVVSYKVPTNEDNTGNTAENKDLSEYAYSEMAGWMFTINNEPAAESINNISVKDGDVIRLQFSVYGWGADLGYDTESYTGIPKLDMANKDNLLKAIAEVNTQKTYWMAYPNVKIAYDNALKTAGLYNPSQEAVDNALKALQTAQKKPTYPTIKKAAISKVKNVRTYKAKISVKKMSNVRGYQYKYSVSKKFTKSTVKNSTKTSLTTKKLKKKQTCYAKVRAYKLVNGFRIYGNWSKVKSVKIKK